MDVCYPGMNGEFTLVYEKSLFAFESNDVSFLCRYDKNASA